MRLYAHSFKCVALSLMLLIFSAAPSTAHATDRFYPDISATSPSGQYRLEAKSPQNADGRRRPFQRDFVYTLTDTKTNTVVWTRTQPKDGESSPIAAWVHDSGTAVVRTGWDQLMTFSRESPVPAGMLSILEQFPATERDQYVHDTTAGPQWSQSSRWYFVTIDDSLYFAVRTWWGRRVIVECASGTIEDSPRVHAAVVAPERANTLQTLLIASKQPDVIRDPRTGQADWEYASEVIAAIQMAGKEGLSEAIPHLLELEKWTYVGTTSMVPLWFDNPLPDGYVDPFGWGEYTVRAKAQTALRRLGARPAGLPATCFWHSNKDRKSRQLVNIKFAGDRVASVDQVQSGMSPLDVITLIGVPDAVVRAEGHGWEYDMDSEKPFTLRVCWTTVNPPTVSGVERFTPPRWVDDDVRDDD
jgi:hypothetical protein